MNVFRKRFFSVLVPAASLCVALLAAEFLVRQSPYGRPKLDLTPFFQYDPLLGWTNRPLAKGAVYDWEYITTLQYNARGMRGPEHPYEKPADTYRVLMIGDSFVDGYTVEYGQRSSEVLESALNAARPARHVEVLAAGVSGYSTDQEMLWYEREGYKYAPDLVLLMFYDNDVFGNGVPEFYGAKPVFRWDGQKLSLHNVPPPHAPPGHHGTHDRARWGLNERFPNFNRWASEHSRLYRLVMVDLAQVTPLPTYGPLYRRQETPETRSQWDVTGQLLRRFRDDVTAKDASFLIFYIPRREDVHRKEWDADRERLHLNPADWDLQAVTDRFLGLCQADAFSCFNGTPAFVAAAPGFEQKKERLYNRYDAHWNVNGHRLAGKILAAKIQPDLDKLTVVH